MTEVRGECGLKLLYTKHYSQCSNNAGVTVAYY